MSRMMGLAVCLAMGCAVGAGCRDDCEKVFDRTVDCVSELGANDTVVKGYKKREKSFLKLCRSTDANKALAAKCLKKKTCAAFIACNRGRGR